MRSSLYRAAIAGVAASTLLASAPLAGATTCFTGFSGTVHYQFTAAPATFVQSGTRALVGTVFGSLSPCAGLSQWPLLATEIVTPGAITLGFRAMTVDAAGCGATDNIVSLASSTLSGTLQLHNDRNNFSNTTTLAFAACVAPPSVNVALVRGKDAAGNE